jgi:predicted nucleic acid-binding protein
VTTAAYVDSSCLIAIATSEPGYREVRARLARFDKLFSSTLLEAEVRAVLARKGETRRLGNIWAWVSWVIPYRRLTQEMDQVLGAGAPRGSDLWHLASAVFLRTRVGDLSFLTLDAGQAEIARSLGFGL